MMAPSHGRAGLVQVLHGTLDQRAETLTELNGRGAGVYITINTTDGTGRKAKNITGHSCPVCRLRCDRRC